MRASAWRSGEAVLAPRSLSLFFKAMQFKRQRLNGGRPCASGFSLIEVMLAVVILGIGILGLSAIFAGGARQQQISSNIIDSVAIGLNTKATLKRKLGSLECGNSTPGQWVWIRSISPTETALDVSTIDQAGSSFFRVTAPIFDLYTAPADIMGGPPLGAVGQGTYVDGAGGSPFGNGAVRQFPHERVIPSSLTIRVSVAQQGIGVGLDQTFVFTMPAPPLDCPELNQPVVLRLANDPNNTLNVIRVDPGQVGTNAFIQSFNLTNLITGGTKWISKIEVLPYDWRSTELVSINERLSYVDDGRFPPAGRRPDLGYVLFFRQFGELNQAMVVIYSLSPQSRPSLNADQFPLVPPDDLATQNVDALVREAPANIGWDPARKQYFIRVKDDVDNRWLAKPGQILLMKNKLTGTDPAGADDVVRVISQRIDPDDDTFLRGYLDDAPRVKLEAVIPQNTTNQLAQIQVYALQPEIVNADPLDKTRWKVRPVDARLVPIVAQ